MTAQTITRNSANATESALLDGERARQPLPARDPGPQVDEATQACIASGTPTTSIGQTGQK